ncbi:hypothetical protein E4T56_gene20506 [Termitomyces sp. T112]|nr:hypothetical protein E4T56_gene20506 [Termitomyces sp. T112]
MFATSKGNSSRSTGSAVVSSPQVPSCGPLGFFWVCGAFTPQLLYQPIIWLGGPELQWDASLLMASQRLRAPMVSSVISSKLDTLSCSVSSRFMDIPYALIPGGLSPVDLATWALGQFRAKCPSSLHRKHLFTALSSASSSLLNAYFGLDALANHFGLDDPGLFHRFSFQTMCDPHGACLAKIGGLADSQGEIDMLLLRPRSQPSPGTPPPEPLHPTLIIRD